MTKLDKPDSDEEHVGLPDEEHPNRTFLLAAGILGGLVILGLFCIAGYLFLSNRTNQQNESTAVGDVTRQAATIQAGLSQTAAVTDTVPPSNTPVIVEPTYTLAAIDAPATVTVAAAFTQLAVSTQTIIPTSTALPGLSPATATLAVGFTQAAAPSSTPVPTSTSVSSSTPVSVVKETEAALPSAGLRLSVLTSPQTYSRAGETITFTYTITNTGNAPLGPAQFIISGNKPSGTVNCGPSGTTLAPNESLRCLASYTVTQADVESATITSMVTASGGGQASAEVSVMVVNLSAPGTTMPSTSTPSPGANIQEQAATAVENYPKAEYKIVAPVSLNVDQSYIVQLYMSRSLSGSELSTQIVATKSLETSTSDPDILVNPEGQSTRLEGGVVEVTPLMQVELDVENEAFQIKALHANSTQEVLATKTAVWMWRITARKEGRHNLTFVIRQQTRIDEDSSWVTLQPVTRVIQVNVTVGQRLGSLDWKWIVGTILTLMLILAIWRWANSLLQKRSSPLERALYRGGEGSRPSTENNILSRLPRLLMAEGEDIKPSGNIFISYRRADSADIADRIYERLVEEFEKFPTVEIFRDVYSIPLGVNFKEILEQKLGECRVLLAIIGDHWVEDDTGKRRLNDPEDFVRAEIEAALDKEIPVIPILVRNASMPKAEDLPDSLQRLVFMNGTQIRPARDFHWDMENLISQLYKSLAKQGSSSSGQGVTSG